MPQFQAPFNQPPEQPPPFPYSPQQYWQQPPPYVQPGTYQQMPTPVAPPQIMRPEPQPRPQQQVPWVRYIIAILIAISAIGGLFQASHFTSTNTPISTPTASDSSSSSSSSSSSASSSSAPITWITTHTFNGNGNKKTAIFGVSNDWKIAYACTYQNIDGYTSDGEFGLSVYSADGSILDANAIFVTCKNGVAQTTGETEEHQGGQVYLDIYATGAWAVLVQEPK